MITLNEDRDLTVLEIMRDITSSYKHALNREENIGRVALSYGAAMNLGDTPNDLDVYVDPKLFEEEALRTFKNAVRNLKFIGEHKLNATFLSPECKVLEFSVWHHDKRINNDCKVTIHPYHDDRYLDDKNVMVTGDGWYLPRANRLALDYISLMGDHTLKYLQKARTIIEKIGGHFLLEPKNAKYLAIWTMVNDMDSTLVEVDSSERLTIELKKVPGWKTTIIHNSQKPSIVLANGKDEVAVCVTRRDNVVIEGITKSDFLPHDQEIRFRKDFKVIKEDDKVILEECDKVETFLMYCNVVEESKSYSSILLERAAHLFLGEQRTFTGNWNLLDRAKIDCDFEILARDRQDVMNLFKASGDTLFRDVFVRAHEYTLRYCLLESTAIATTKSSVEITKQLKVFENVEDMAYAIGTKFFVAFSTFGMAAIAFNDNDYEEMKEFFGRNLIDAHVGTEMFYKLSEAQHYEREYEIWQMYNHD